MKKKKIALSTSQMKKVFIAILLSAFLLRSGDFLLNYGLNTGNSAIIAPIAGSYPTFFAILAFFVFRDPITRQQVVGVVITLAGILLLNVVSLFF